jgi:aryl-alcohol dehydrogenase-like predicted oxidoreductase
MGRWTRTDEAGTRATLTRAMELGLRWFDTAEVYGGGRSERVLGDVLARAGPLSPPAFVATKVWSENARGPQVRAALIGSLRRLGLPWVDLFLLHSPNPHVPVAETLTAMADLHHAGKVGSIGVSNFSVEELEEARTTAPEVPIVVNQVRYSLLAPEEGEAVLDYCRRNHILLEAYSPLTQGLLAGRHLDGNGPPMEIRRLDPAIFQHERLAPMLERARRLRDLSREAKVPLASVALHWLAVRGVAPVFGATRPEQVDEIVRAWTSPPPDDVLERADAIAGGQRA